MRQSGVELGQRDGDHVIFSPLFLQLHVRIVLTNQNEHVSSFGQSRTKPSVMENM